MICEIVNAKLIVLPSKTHIIDEPNDFLSKVAVLSVVPTGGAVGFPRWDGSTPVVGRIQKFKSTASGSTSLSVDAENSSSDSDEGSEETHSCRGSY